MCGGTKIRFVGNRAERVLRLQRGYRERKVLARIGSHSVPPSEKKSVPRKPRVREQEVWGRHLRPLIRPLIARSSLVRPPRKVLGNLVRSKARSSQQSPNSLRSLNGLAVRAPARAMQKSPSPQSYQTIPSGYFPQVGNSAASVRALGLSICPRSEQAEHEIAAAITIFLGYCSAS
jgi:hypothetical protein